MSPSKQPVRRSSRLASKPPINYFPKKINNREHNKKLKHDIDLLCQMIEYQFNIDNSENILDPDVIMMMPL